MTITSSNVTSRAYPKRHPLIQKGTFWKCINVKGPGVCLRITLVETPPFSFEASVALPPQTLLVQEGHIFGNIPSVQYGVLLSCNPICFAPVGESWQENRLRYALCLTLRRPHVRSGSTKKERRLQKKKYHSCSLRRRCCRI